MPKGSRYKSKYDPTIVPTATTFGNHTTSKIVGNMQGDVHPPGGHHLTKKDQTWGLPKGKAKPDPHNFSKKGTGTMRLTDKRKLSYIAFSNFQ